MKKSFVLVGSGVFVAAAVIIVPMWLTGPASISSADLVKRDIEKILLEIESFERTNGHFPPWEDGVVESLSGKSQGPRDFWSMPFRYQEHNGKVTVYSFGPNAKDDRGGGDDILPR